MKFLAAVNDRRIKKSEPYTLEELDAHENSGRIWATIAECKREAEELSKRYWSLGFWMDDTETQKTLIWGVVEGPVHISEFPVEEVSGYVQPGYEWMLVCKIEEGGAMGLANLWYETMDEAYEVKKYFDTNIQPLELEN